MKQQQAISTAGLLQGDLIKWLIQNSSSPAESDQVIN
jgi:hypothetical protein